MFGLRPMPLSCQAVVILDGAQLLVQVLLLSGMFRQWLLSPGIRRAFCDIVSVFTKILFVSLCWEEILICTVKLGLLLG